MSTRSRIFLLSSLLLLSTVATAQDLESLAGVRLSFDRAGARALGMGSTAIAVQDADGVAANPASIAGAKRSFSIEERRSTIEGRYLADRAMNTIGVRSSTDGIRSATLTLPFRSTTWSFFYDQPLNVQHSTAGAYVNPSSEAVFICGGRITDTHCNEPAYFFNFPATYPMQVSLQQRRYGAAAAWSRGKLGLGASLRREELQQSTGFILLPQVTTPFFSAGMHAGVGETIDDTATTWSAGATWSFTPRARIGASYASGGSFSGERSFPNQASLPLEFHTPPSLAAGFSIDPLPHLTIAADAVRVSYSEMMHDERSLFPQGSELGYPDVTELHAGAEYRIGKLALRAGWWRDPSHGLRVLNGIMPPAPATIVPVLLDPSENHVTAGIGYGEKTRFDASIDRSEQSTRVSFGVSMAF